MSDLQNLLEKSRIPFPKSMNPEQIEDLFEYLTKKNIDVNCEINYNLVMNNNDPKNFFKQKYCSKISGTMTEISQKLGYVFSSFDCSREIPKDLDEEEGLGEFYGINFSTFEPKEKEVQLWDKVRELTQKYFSNKE